MRFLTSKYLLLLSLPVIYLFLTGVFFVYWRPFYTIGPDPIYAYLLNAMTIANTGHIKVVYVDHPGIPVQCFCAFIIYIKHLFNHSIPLYQDVLLHPESYIYVLCATTAIIYALVVWITGYYVFKRTGNVTTSLLFQLTPLVCSHGILTTASPSPESFYIIAGIFLMAYIYCNTVVSDVQSPGNTKFRHALVYGIFTAFFIACKYICFPLVFLILFVLPASRLRIKYLVSLAIFLCIFMSPSFSAWRNVKQWLFGLATHTGQYGQGAQGFANTSEYSSNLVKIFTGDKYFTIIFILLIVALCTAFIKRKQLSGKGKMYARILFGVGISSLVLILLVAKHYSFHYLIPVQLCYPLIIAGSYNIFKDNYKASMLQNRFVAVTLFYVFVFFLAFTQISAYIAYPPRPINPSTANFLSHYKNIPILIDADFESSRVEPAINLGVAYTGDFRNQYWEFLKRIYPNTYQYKYPQEIITRWDEVLYPPELIAKHPQILVYFKQKDSAIRDAIIKNICIWKDDTIAHVRLVFSLKQADEYIYEINGNSDAAKGLLSKWMEVNFDLEKTNPGKSEFISTDGKDTASGTDLLSTKEHHSGNNSIRMDWKHQHALRYCIRAIPGQLIVADIWRKAGDGNGCIIFTSGNKDDILMSGQTAMDSGANGWKHIECKLLIPSLVKDSAIYSSLYYYGRGTAYFDDLLVRVYSMKK